MRIYFLDLIILYTYPVLYFLHYVNYFQLPMAFYRICCVSTAKKTCPLNINVLISFLLLLISNLMYFNNVVVVINFITVLKFTRKYPEDIAIKRVRSEHTTIRINKHT